MPDKDGRTAGRHLGVILALHAALLLFSLSSVVSKLASRQEPLSWGFVVLYGVLLLILAVYAVAWQQIIKRLPLTFAYANRAATVVWGIVWGALLFDEPITLPMMVGACVIIAGIILYATDEGDTTGGEGK